MKYYIPTTNLNIDNLFTTESISPNAYYPIREIKPNNFESIPYSLGEFEIFLFSEIPAFELKRDEFEHYPIVIEFEDSEQLLDCKNVYNGDRFSIISCNHTLFLTPWNTSIIAFDQRAYDASKIRIDLSRSCKLGAKFKWKTVTPSIQLEEMLEKINSFETEINCNDFPKEIAKGALWGYVLGVSKSTTPLAAMLQRLFNEIRNIVSSTISNLGSCKPSFYERLVDLANKYKEIVERQGYESWSEKCTSEEKSTLEKYNVYNDALSKFFKEKGYIMSPEVPSEYSNIDIWKSYRNELEYCSNQYLRKSHKFDSDSIDWTIFKTCTKSFNIADYELINLVINLLLYKKIDKELLRINKKEAANIILSNVSGLLRQKKGEDEWKKEPMVKERIYINGIYKNIVNYEPFDLNFIEDLELKSIAAFILKGEDIEALTRYLLDNEMSNHALVMMLWGACEGYSSINKTLVIDLILPDIVSKINKLIGINSYGKSFPEQYVINERLYTPISCNSKESIEFVSPQVRDMNDIYKLFLKIKVGNKCISKENSRLIADYFKECGFQDNDAFYRKIKSLKGIGMETVKSIKTIIGGHYAKKNYSMPVKEATLQFADDMVDKNNDAKYNSILNDENIKEFVKSRNYLTDDQKNKIIEAVNSVIKCHTPGGRQSGETRNEKILEHLERYCLAKSKTTDIYICLNKDNPDDVEAVKKLCIDLSKRYIR